MSLPLFALMAGVLVIAALLTWSVRNVALRFGLIDRPNARSSHSIPTPRGGGIAIVAASCLGIAVLSVMNVSDRALTLALLGGGLPIALVGFLDDRGRISTPARFACHVGAAAWAIYILGGLPPLQIGGSAVDLGIAGSVLGAIAIVWTLNLFNFMDGIDGIAASEAAVVTLAGAALCLWSGQEDAVSAAAVVIAAASLGFLVWNWPPAGIFMGDAGSGYLGYTIGVLAIAAAREDAAAAWIWLILGGAFFVDATVTLLRRLARGEQIYQAHRDHAYQHLARRWNSHERVTLAIIAVNLLWLLPWAVLAKKYPELAVWMLLAALAPIVVVSILAGAGIRDCGARRAGGQ